MTNKYTNIIYNFETFPGCCGIGVICDIEEAAEGLFRTAPAKYFRTKKAQAKAFVNEISNVDKYIEDDWTCWNQLQLTLTNQQLPEVHEALLEKGWYIINVFVNAKTENTVTIYGYNFDISNQQYQTGLGVAR